MSKQKRQDMILKIISEQEIDCQQDLVDALIDKGFNATQATVSRDINELQLIKVDGVIKKYRYTTPFVGAEISNESVKILSQIVTAIIPTSNFIVVKTRTGGASTAGNIIDTMSFSSVLGSIAGDDTLLIVMNSKNDAEAIAHKIKDIIKNAE